jgi:hypothetical protein
MSILMTAEGNRLLATKRGTGWRRWGPYLSERQWGTVREDYSPGGTAWDYFPHDHARMRAYRWGEDGIAGFSDQRQHWCLGLALWNGRDEILKERLFGLTNSQGNHGEDVKEVYHYVDATPTHSYMRMIYRYPQCAYPYADLVAENARRNAEQPEYELIDTGAFRDNRYFDIVVEYAKASPDDILMRVTAINRGPEPARLHIIPQLWARNTWAWKKGSRRPLLSADGPNVNAMHPRLRDMRFECDAGESPVFCENETNVQKLFGMDGKGPFKDGINDFVVHGQDAAIRHDQGTKCGFPLSWTIGAGGQRVVNLRFRPTERDIDPFAFYDAIFQARREEADEFYAALQADIEDPDARLVQRQALAGMIWSKQFYLFDVRNWLDGDPAQPKPPPGRTRNHDWRHLTNADVISMPDKWEYPWYAAWDLAFHCTTFALVDPEFAKGQLILMLREWYMHPNGQIPAYEWAFGDVNPPVHAWAAWRVYEMDRKLTGVADTAFLERIFHKLMINFTWWVNRKDVDGRNVFQGGFLGLDNIGVFDRSAPLPTGGTMDQADGTAWMAMYTLNLLRIALELSATNPVYEDTATKFFEHFLYIAEAMAALGQDGTTAKDQGLWSETDGFFYDALRFPDGHVERMRVRSLVGLIPLLAVEVIGAEVIDSLPDFAQRLRWFLGYRQDLAGLISRWAEPGAGERRLLSLLRGHRMKALLRRMLDEKEFLSPFGIRSVSKAHEEKPFVLEFGGQSYGVTYTPGESTTRLFGGNSNWRGPIWFPLNALLIESLRRFHDYYGDDFLIECPVGTGQMMSLAEAANEVRSRLVNLFRKGPDGTRPCLPPAQAGTWAGEETLEFHEFFHGDTGRGLGAAHQTGWTGLIALIIANHATVLAGHALPEDPVPASAAEDASAVTAPTP